MGMVVWFLAGRPRVAASWDR